MFKPTVALIGALALNSLPSALEAQPSNGFQDRVVVTASLSETPEAETPVTVRILEASEIDERRVESVHELLGTLPGVHAVSLGSPGQQTSLFVRGAESDQTLVLWNGVPLNDPYFGGFNWAYLPTEGVERIEVATGPSSALYGSAAVGGVVQLIASQGPVARLELEGGENDHRRVATHWSQRSDDWAFGLQGHWREGDGHYPNDFYDSVEVAGHLGRNFGDQLQLRMRVRSNDSSTGIPFHGATVSRQRRIEWRESQVTLPFEATFENWDLEGYLGQVDYDHHFTDPEDPFGFTEGRTESTAQRARSVATFRRGDRFWIATGAEFETLQVTDRSSYGLNLDAAEQETTGFFAQLHFATDRVAIDLGGRQDDNSVFGTETSPRLGLSLRLHPTLRLRSSYGEGFRAPSLGELFFPFSGNPRLEPERSTGHEVGLAWSHGAWAIDLATFETSYSNLIDYDFATGRNVNLGRARARGAELEVRYRTEALDVRAQWSALDAHRLATGAPLKRRPEDTGSIAATWRPGPATIQWTVSYVGPRADVDAVTFADSTNPSYTRQDVALRWALPQRIVPYLRIVNLTDSTYQEALGFPAPGRTVIAGVTLSR